LIKLFFLKEKFGYHLHVGCWHVVDKFPSVPRFQVPEVTLEEVLELIIRDFLSRLE
jgi:hypothetical protein